LNRTKLTSRHKISNNYNKNPFDNN